MPLALIGASIAGAPAPAGIRRQTGEPAATTPTMMPTERRRATPRAIYRCKGGRHYTYAGGWGCDYYVYSPDYAPRRR